MLNSGSYLNKTDHAINNIIMFELTAVPQKLWDFGGIYIPKKKKNLPIQVNYVSIPWFSCLRWNLKIWK